MREKIKVNIQRQLWANCAGYCQNPACNKYLFVKVDDETVSIANMAHIIGYGKNGPRSNDEICDFIDKNGFENLIMLCLECHKVIDELEKKFGIDIVKSWKHEHESRVKNEFEGLKTDNEKIILQNIYELLLENKGIFDNYGPFSKLALDGEASDANKIWKKRVIDTIIPNNRKISHLVYLNKNNFQYPWDIYRELKDYELHSKAFEENYLFSEKINDYKLFPKGFFNFIEKKLGNSVNVHVKATDEDLNFRSKAFDWFINSALKKIYPIKNIIIKDKYFFEIHTQDDRILYGIGIHTYFVTTHTVERVIEIHPDIKAIVCTNPYSTYSDDAKKHAIESGVGLFKVNEFMGAVKYTGEKYLNYLTTKQRDERILKIKRLLKSSMNYSNFKVYVFGSYIRAQIFSDIDLIFVYNSQKYKVGTIEELIEKDLAFLQSKLDIIVCSEEEFLQKKFTSDNSIRVL